MSDDLDYKGYTITIEQDEDAESPREWCNLGTMLCRHRNYNLGDAQIDTDEMDLIGDPDYDWPTLNAYLIDRHDMAPGSPVLPLYLMDHSGLSMGCAPSPFDSGGWDTSMVGWIFVTNEGVSNCGTPAELWAEVLTDEVATYSQYLEGDVWPTRSSPPTAATSRAAAGGIPIAVERRRLAARLTPTSSGAKSRPRPSGSGST